jgi:hypothetical protein
MPGRAAACCWPVPCRGRKACMNWMSTGAWARLARPDGTASGAHRPAAGSPNTWPRPRPCAKPMASSRGCIFICPFAGGTWNQQDKTWPASPTSWPGNCRAGASGGGLPRPGRGGAIARHHFRRRAPAARRGPGRLRRAAAGRGPDAVQRHRPRPHGSRGGHAAGLGDGPQRPRALAPLGPGCRCSVATAPGRLALPCCRPSRRGSPDAERAPATPHPRQEAPGRGTPCSTVAGERQARRVCPE